MWFGYDGECYFFQHSGIFPQTTAASVCQILLSLVTEVETVSEYDVFLKPLTTTMPYLKVNVRMPVLFIKVNVCMSVLFIMVNVTMSVIL